MNPVKIWDCPREVPPAVEEGTVVAWRGKLYEAVPLRDVVGDDHSGGWCPKTWPQAAGLDAKGPQGAVPDDRNSYRSYNPEFMQGWLCWVPWNGPRPVPTLTDDEAGHFYAEAFHNYVLACTGIGVRVPSFTDTGEKVPAEAKEKARQDIAKMLKERKK